MLNYKWPPVEMSPCNAFLAPRITLNEVIDHARSGFQRRRNLKSALREFLGEEELVRLGLLLQTLEEKLDACLNVSMCMFHSGDSRMSWIPCSVG
jgi:hypothetical protein